MRQTHMSHSPSAPMMSLSKLQSMKKQGEKIACLTAYDATFAKLMSAAGVEILLVGDTLGMVIGGHSSTVPVTIQDMVYHIRNVARANTNAWIIGDMPFMTYPNVTQALKHAAQLMRAGAMMIKLEGGAWVSPIIAALNEQGIPVCAHLGLTPQSVHNLGGYKIQGRSASQAQEILQAAEQHQAAGAKMLVLECVPYPLAQTITQTLDIPVIGIGAGSHCDGQILVTYDMLGLSLGKPLTFVKNFLANQPEGILGAFRHYVQAVKQGQFPTREHSFE